MNPKAEGFSQRLEHYRQYLALLARLQLAPGLQGKVDLSGVVQQTLLEAHQESDKLASLNEAQQAAWLRRALANNLTDEVRKLGTAMRQIERECSLENALEESSARLEAWLASEQTSPGDQAERNEELLRLAGALAQLPSEQRQAVELYHLRELPVNEVSRLMERSKSSVMGLLHRGVRKLRELLGEEDGE
jgi:RNA polymerase sigma-70 factor (ECF subfamily)